MPKSRKELVAGASAKLEANSFFGPPALLLDEDARFYDELAARIGAQVKPADILEEIWVRDVVDLVWEALRLRRLKASLLTSTAHTGLRRIIGARLSILAEEELPKRWAHNEPNARKQVDALLKSSNLDMDAVMANTLAYQLRDIERIDRLLASAELRRNAVLREIERHRTTLAATLRRASEEIETAEFEIVDEPRSATEAT